MMYEEVKKELKRIADLASTVPEPFRERCFEMLLEHFLAGLGPPAPLAEAPVVETSKVGGRGVKIPVPAQVRVFLQRTGVTEEELAQLLLYEDGELHFIKEPTATKVATGQIEWSLLLALRNGILNDSLATDPEEVRSICQEKGFYDRGNFAAIFRRPGNARLFKQPPEPQGAPQPLSTEGQKALGKLIKSLVGTPS